MAITAAGGMLETAALGSTFVAGGVASSPPATAMIGAFSLGWTAGTVVGNGMDRTFKPGSGAAGNWWYEHVAALSGGAGHAVHTCSRADLTT